MALLGKRSRAAKLGDVSARRLRSVVCEVRQQCVSHHGSESVEQQIVDRRRSPRDHQQLRALDKNGYEQPEKRGSTNRKSAQTQCGPSGKKSRTLAAVSSKSDVSGPKRASPMSLNGRSRTWLSFCSGSKVRTPIAINDAARATFESGSSLLGRFLGIRGTVVATMNERL